MFALDTNTIIYFFKGLGGVAERLAATPPAEVVIPSVVHYELLVGLEKSQRPSHRRAQLDALIDVIRLAPFGPAEAQAAARIRADLESRGTPIGPVDTLIAGTALAHRCTLVTRNLSEFGRVNGLALDDWF